MKTLKLILAGIALLFASVAANATAKSHTIQPTQDDVLNIYVNAVTKGSVNGLDGILDSELKFNTMRGDNVSTLNKDQFIEYVKASAVSGTQVNTVKTVLESDDNAAKIKIEFQYDGYTRTDVVTLAKTNEWEVTAVDSSTK